LLGHNPSNSIFENILASVESRASWSFGDFVCILDKCRTACAEENHKRAGWSDVEFEFLCQRFQKCCGKVEGTLTKGELLWILMDLGITIKTSAARNSIVSKVPEARTLALKAGVNEKDVMTHGDSTVTVWVLAHLLRLLARGGEEEIEDREILAREETKFSHAEIVEFSEVFAKLVNESTADRDSLGLAQNHRRNSAPAWEVGQTCLSARPLQTQLVPLPASKSQSEAECAILRSLSGTHSAAPKLSISALRELLNSFGAKVSLEENQVLRSKVLEVARGQGELDFSDFLRVMRWMLDSNFADINAKAKEVAGQNSSVFQRSLGGA
jgi:Ca2+-binding EF-hand superfamily protein